MKKIIFLAIFVMGVSLSIVEGQTVKDPLLYYFQQIQSYAKPTDTVYVFQANFTGGNQPSIFITDDQSKLGPHGNYSWSVFCPQQSRGYSVAGNGLDADIDGPRYIGYIDQANKYGAITAREGGKYGITVQYLENGAIQSKSIDQERGHADEEHYPTYFTAKFPDYGITKYTLAQLQQKYASSDSTNVITPAAK